MKDIATEIAKRQETLNKARLFIAALDDAYESLCRISRAATAREEARTDREKMLYTIRIIKGLYAIRDKTDEADILLKEIADTELGRNLSREMDNFMPMYREIND